MATDSILNTVAGLMLIPVALAITLGALVPVSGDPSGTGIALALAAVLLPNLAFIKRLPTALRVSAVVGSPLCLSLAGMLHAGPTLGAALYLILGLTAATVFYGLKGGLITLGTGASAWLLVGWGHSHQWFAPTYATLTDHTAVLNQLRMGVLIGVLALISHLALDRLMSRLSDAFHTQAERRTIIEAEDHARAEAEAALEATEIGIARARAHQTLGRLASGVAHDFNNALMVILAAAELTGDAATAPEGSELRSASDAINHAIARASSLTRQLLAFSRPDAPHRTALALDGALSEALDLARRLCPPNLVIQVPTSRHAHVMADHRSITQLILLVTLQAMAIRPEGGRFLIEVVSQPDQVTLQFTVEGDEPPSEAAPQQQFSLDDQALVELVDLLGGEVYTESAAHAQRLLVVLDRITPHEEEAPLSSPDRRPSQGTVMVVEDERVVRRIICRALVSAGYSVLEAADGQEALDQLKRAAVPVELLCTDGMMPRMDGPTLVERVRLLQPDLPILVCTAHFQNEGLVQRLRSGDVRLLAKPFQPGALINAVNDLLEEALA